MPFTYKRQVANKITVPRRKNNLLSVHAIQLMRIAKKAAMIILGATLTLRFLTDVLLLLVTSKRYILKKKTSRQRL